MLGMLEKRKDESESIEKYRSILTAAVIACLLLFATPTLVGFLTGVDSEGYTSDGAIFGLPGQPRMPEVFITSVFGVLQPVLWIARVVIVLFIVMAVVMLRMPRQTYAPASRQQRHYKAY